MMRVVCRDDESHSQKNTNTLLPGSTPVDFQFLGGDDFKNFTTSQIMQLEFFFQENQLVCI